MIDIATVPDEQMNQTLRLIKAAIMKRGWKAEILYVGSAHCFIDRGDGKKLHIFSTTPPTVSYGAAHLANDKFATYQVLKQTDVPQLETRLVTDTLSDQDYAFMHELGRIVVKPIDGGHGEGITINVSSDDELRRAMTEALTKTRSTRAVLLQKQYLHDPVYDVRVLCINYKCVAATWRVPARVLGDGTHSLGELIEKENASEKRGRAYYASLAVIDVQKAYTFLGDRINEVPKEGERVSVLGVGNYGAGGETIDVTDDLPEWLRDLAEHAARTSELAVAGVDFMLAITPHLDSTREQLDPIVTEINKSPSFGIHDHPTSGIARNTTDAYMDYLAQLE